MKRDGTKIQAALLDSTILVIANEGFDNASTRKIASTCELPDAYIYQHFQSKSDLFAKAFQKEDAALAAKIKKHLMILNQQGITNEDRLYVLFSKIWMQLVAYPEKCQFYMQYYYSPYYKKYSEQDHLTLWMPALEQLKTLFRPGTDVRATLHSVLNMMLSQAIKAAAEDSTDTDASARRNYELVLGMLGSSLLEDQ